MEKLTVFDNGLRLVTKKIDGMYSATIGIWVGTGSSDEEPKFNGISHFIEHMLFKGTKNRTAFEISDTADRIGAQINAFTSKECTCYYMKAISEYNEKCFDILSDMLFNSLFDKVELDKERNVILEEISMTQDTPDDLVHDMLSEAMYKGSTLANTILGTQENVKRFGKDDILEFMEKQYCPKNIVISVAGNFDDKKVVEWTKKYFAEKFENTNEQSLDKLNHIAVDSCFSHSFKKVEQAHVAIGFPSISFMDENSEKALIISNILGGGMSSRLFQKVREELGLAYSVYAYLSSYKNNGLLTIYAGINPANVDLTIATIRAEINNFIEKGFTENEFNRAKSQLKGTFIMTQESNSSIMNALGKYMVIGDVLFNMERKIKAIEDVSFDSATEYLKNFFNFKEVACAYVGPKIDNYNVLDIFKK